MALRFAPSEEGIAVSKDKKKKKDKKHNGSGDGKAPKKAAKTFQAIAQNPLVADVVAAALISMAAALKDSEKAKRIANQAGDQLAELSKKSSKQGNAMWDLALDIGRRTLETLAGEESAKGNSGRK
jgi:capsular polysaccharide biosynthesis protein